MNTPPPFWRLRTILLLVFGVPLLAFCVWSAWAVHWAFNAEEGSSVDYAKKMEELVASRQVADAHQPNRWDEFAGVIVMSQESTRAYYESLYNSSVPINVNNPPSGWPEGWSWPPHPADVLATNTPDIVLMHTRAIIAAHEQAGVFERLAALRNQRHFVRPLPSNEKLLNILLPELGHARALTRTGTARQRLAHQAGDDATMLASFEGTLTLARALGRQSTLIDRLVAIAIRAMACQELRTELIERAPSEEMLVALLRALDHVDTEPGLELSLEGERLFAMDTIQWTHTDDGNGDGRFIPSAAGPLSSMAGGTPISASPIANLAGFVMPSKKETTLAFNEFYDLAIQEAASTPGSRAASGRILDEWIEALPRLQVLPKLLLPAFDKAIHASDASTLDVASTRLMLAIEIHRARTGVLPAALADLVPGILPALPVDPWNPDGFVYRPDASQRAGYTLYSKGADGVDNGGAFDPKANQESLRPKGAGKDYRILQERDRRE
ncbi:MAG: hypothetical protein HUU18_04580 [Phycisphaerales bacterium]|nr:hypothetical protein [Phycisphaerales bacterium]